MLTQKVNRQLNNTNGVQVSYGVIEGGSGKSAGRIEVAQGVVALSTPLKWWSLRNSWKSHNKIGLIPGESPT